MAAIILDCELMRYQHSGLYFYCDHLSLEINKILVQQGKEPLFMYLPRKKYLSLPNEPYHIIAKKIHKHFPRFLKDCKVWHAPFQSATHIFPDKKQHPEIKVVLTIHDLNALHEGKSKVQQIKSLARTQHLIDRADAIVCISEFTKTDVEKNCNIADKKITVIHNGVSAKVEPALQQTSYEPRRRFLFGMGYMNTKKNYHVLLPLLHGNEDIELVLAGRLDDTDYIKSMQREAVRLGVVDRLNILGPIDEHEKNWYLSNCLAFMHPSLAEGFGITVVEAMSYGKPVFLSQFTSLPEVGGDVAFYFDSFEAKQMNDTFNDGMAAMNDNHKQRLIDRASLFDWQTSALQYIKVYHSLM